MNKGLILAGIAIAISVLVMTITAYRLGYDIAKQKIPFNVSIEVQKPYLEDSSLTISNVLRVIIKEDIKEPLIVLKQAMLETRWLKCSQCSLNFNNLFGMGWNGNTYFKYDHWIESVQHYKVWQNLNYREGDYYQFLEKVGYAETKDYVIRLKGIKL